MNYQRIRTRIGRFETRWLDMNNAFSCNFLVKKIPKHFTHIPFPMIYGDKIRAFRKSKDRFNECTYCFSC